MKRRHLILGASGLLGTAAVGRLEAKPPAALITKPLIKPTIKPMDGAKPQEANPIGSPETLGKMVTLGRDVMGYFTAPVGVESAPAVLVLMEAFGLNANIKSVCDRLAKAGYAALAPDFYHGETFAYTDAPKAIEKLKTIKDEQVTEELALSLKFLAQQTTVDHKRLTGVTGFCMGGRLTFLAAAAFPKQIGAAVAFYGGGIAAMPDPFGRKDLLDRVPAISAPIMFMYGADDSYIMAEEHERIALAMSKAKKSYSMNVFSGAGHGFMSDRRDSYNQASADEAWAMTKAFFDRHLIAI